MSVIEPRDLLIECGGCGIENVYSDYTPDQVLVCNQCRERQLWPNFNETHKEYRCQGCNISICLLRDTPFDEGNTPCRCGSLKVFQVHPSTIAQDAEAAGAYALEGEEDPGEIDPGFDWYRSEPSGGQSDYNEMFDQDPGHN